MRRKSGAGPNGALAMFAPIVEASAAPEIAAEPDRDQSRITFESAGWIRVNQFLRPDFAREVGERIPEDLIFESIAYGGLTRLSRGAREVGDAYHGKLCWRDAPSASLDACCAIFESNWLLQFLHTLTQREVQLMRPPSIYRMSYGDRICLHDDMSDPDHCLSVVLGLTPGWREGDGGETRFGRVASVRDLPTPPELPFQLREWTLQDGYVTLPPAFNTLTVMRLGQDLAHGVNPVTTNRTRLSIVALYGWQVSYE